MIVHRKQYSSMKLNRLNSIDFITVIKHLYIVIKCYEVKPFRFRGMVVN